MVTRVNLPERMGVYRAFGLMVTLWALHMYFADTFEALDDAATASLNTIEVVAETSSKNIDKIIVP